MTETRLICDRCGEVVLNPSTSPQGSNYEGWTKWELRYSSPTEDYDLCPECTDAFRKWLKS